MDLQLAKAAFFVSLRNLEDVVRAVTMAEADTTALVTARADLLVCLERLLEAVSASPDSDSMPPRQR